MTISDYVAIAVLLLLLVWAVAAWIRQGKYDGGSALLTSHAERKASLTPMGIHRDRPPMNSITARRQRLERNAYHVAVDLRLALIDARPGGICYVGRAKCGL